MYQLDFMYLISLTVSAKITTKN